MKHWLCTLALAFFGLTMPAKAGVLLEPYAGYSISSSEGLNKTTDLTEKSSDNGAALGARLAYVLPLGVWLGLDYFYQPSTPVKFNDPPNTPDATATRNVLFIDIGFDLPGIDARFFAGYGVSNEWKLTQNSGDTVYSGNAFKFGAGYKPGMNLAINIEYIQHMFSKVKSGSGSDVSLDDAYDNFKSSTVLLSLSVPLMF